MELVEREGVHGSVVRGEGAEVRARELGLRVCVEEAGVGCYAGEEVGDGFVVAEEGVYARVLLLLWGGMGAERDLR